MKQPKTTTILMLLALATSHTFAKEPSNCLMTKLSQKEMQQCPKIHYKQADSELNRVYGVLQDVYKKDKLFLKKLKQSQRIWIKLRDANFEMQFPHAKEQGYYGSIFPTCADGYKIALTLQRVEFLKQWVTGVEEGENCSGSKRIAITDDTPQKNDDEIKKVCYENVTDYTDGSKMKDVTKLNLSINYGDGTVKGIYNYLPAEKDQRLGKIEGSLWKGAISAKYTFEQEGEKESVNLRIHLDENKAVIEGAEKDKGLGVSGTIKEVPCK